MATIAANVPQIKVYGIYQAVFIPDRTATVPRVLLGEATCTPDGYFFQQEGCDWSIPVTEADRRLTLGKEVTA